MNEQKLEQILAIVQRDPGGRGLASDPSDNLITATAGDFARACRHIATHPSPRIAIVTGFTIPSADPPCGETDGPLGALFLARAFAPLGISVTLASDGTTLEALQAGVAAAGLTHQVPVVELPEPSNAEVFRAEFCRRAGQVNVLIALERVGPNHHDSRCYSMRGRDMSHLTRPAHFLFESTDAFTIGIGDGGNEIGMGKIPRATIARNITDGEKVACRTPTDQLIVAGISNWGAYALAVGTRLLMSGPPDARLFDLSEERRLLKIMIDAGPLIDGVTLQRAESVDGIEFPAYASVLNELLAIFS